MIIIKSIFLKIQFDDCTFYSLHSVAPNNFSNLRTELHMQQNIILIKGIQKLRKMMDLI